LKKKQVAVKPDDAEQSKLFLEKAREIGADEAQATAADKLMERLAKTPPEPRKNK
jgi:hypothetical protein